MSAPTAGTAIAGVGVWDRALRFGEPSAVAEAAAELEQLGFTALWFGDVGGDVLAAVDHLLAATASLTVATGVLNVWRHDAAEIGAWWGGLDERLRSRTMLGLGISHAPLIGEGWGSPMTVMNRFLDDLATAGVDRAHTCLAALGPRMLGLARQRTAGAHPYLTTPEHTARAREIVGPECLLAPEQGVVLESDPATARAIAREQLGLYAGLPNYTGNWRRLGFGDGEIASLDDRLVDALVAWGDEEAIARRVGEHFSAGADHVCIQVLRPRDAPMPSAAWRALAAALN